MRSAPIPPFRVDVEPDREWITVSPCGELDCATVPRLATTVAELREVGFDALRIDLSALAFAGTDIAYLIGLTGDCADGLRLELVRAPATVQRVFALAEVEDLLPFLPR